MNIKFKQKSPKDQQIVILGAIEGTISNYEDGIIRPEWMLMQIKTYLDDLKELSKYMKEEW